MRCDLGSLAATADATVTLVVTPTTDGTLSTTASVASNVSDPDGPNNAATRDVAVAFAPTPSVTSIAPLNGIAGTSVTINGTGLTGATSVTFNGVPAVVTGNTDTQITADVPAEATTGKIAVTTPGGTATSAATFTVKPNITGFTPASGGVGDSVTIDGTGFGGATAVKFDGKAATLPGSHPVTQIVTTVPANATSGKITVTTPAGTATSAANFLVAPRISSFMPSIGPAGASVVLNGANFAGVTSVTFNGVAATFVANSGVKITATVPAAATTGPIAVTAAGGVGTSASSFTVSVTPAITNITPDSGPVGVTVTIDGTNFTGVTAVKLNGTSAKITFKSDTQLRIKVPMGATTGPISVTTPGGTAVSAETFVVAPRIKSFSPASGASGRA